MNLLRKLFSYLFTDHPLIQNDDKEISRAEAVRLVGQASLSAARLSLMSDFDIHRADTDLKLQILAQNPVGLIA